VEDFEREARSTAALSSPHTVRVLDLGRTREGLPYYAMELLEGMNLEELTMQYGPQPAGRVIHLLRQACRSLAEAHGIGLIHRDIKSANLELVSLGGELDVLKVLDFGLACPPGYSSVHGDPGLVRGTLAYLPPEAAVEGGLIDARSDLYALGCVAYELLTGHLVFNSVDPMQLLRAHAFRPPTPPSLRSRRPIPQRLESLVMALLSKRPEDRPASAAHVENLLSEMAADLPWSQADAQAWWGHAVREPLATSDDAVPAGRPTVSLRRSEHRLKASA
jgi:serine/threonine-protein kinase